MGVQSQSKCYLLLMLFRMVDKHLNFHDLGRPGGKKPLRFSSSAHFLSFLRIDQKNKNKGGDQTKLPER